MPGWASSGNRWAPETTTLPDGTQNVLFFSDSQPSGPRRVGWAWAAGGPAVGGWNRTAPTHLDLGNSDAGEIDQHIFRAANGSTYIVWKTDDNSLQKKITRIWAQEIIIADGAVRLVGPRVQILDSSGMWWVTSFVQGGSLVEGPEIVEHGGWFYLFFAAGCFCQESYSEGVARSRSVFGPYEKMGSPLLTTAIVGHALAPPDGDGNATAVGARANVLEKLVGPGHASFVEDSAGEWFAVYHASRGNNCGRYAFVDKMRFGADGWPRMDFE